MDSHAPFYLTDSGCGACVYVCVDDGDCGNSIGNFRLQFYSPHRSRIQLHDEGFSSLPLSYLIDPMFVLSHLKLADPGAGGTRYVLPHLGLISFIFMLNDRLLVPTL